ncbi:MAG: substrate-binding domain-containing protein, partial [Blautia faecis]
MRRAKAYLLVLMGVASVLLGGCSGSSKANMEEAAEQPAVVDYTCISNPESDKQIYVILKNYHGAYWEKVIDGITEAAKKLDEAVYLGGIDNETDISGQIDLMNQAMEQGADGILLAPADSNSLADSCQKVREKDIPVVLIDSSINSSEFDACYMTDNIDAGEMAAKEMLEMLYDAGNSPTDPLEVGIQLSSDTSQAMVNRVSGFLNFWAGNAPEQWEIVQDIRVNGGDTKKAQSDASALLRENADIKGFFGCNNTSTVGIVNTLFEEERTDVVLNIINLRLDITHLYYPAKNSFQKGRLKRREIFTELLLYT